MRSRLLLLAGLTLACGCTRSPEPAATTAAPAPPPGPAVASATAADATAPSLPAIVITNLGPGQFEIESPSPVRLAKLAAIERQGDDGGFAEIPYLDVGRGYRLVERCESPLPDGPPAATDCIDLAPGTAFRPVPYQGLSCSAQCNGSCRANSYAGPGSFRLAVRVCGGEKISGPSFELPDYQHVGSLWRWGIGSDIVRATVARIDGPIGNWEPTNPPSPERIAGIGVHPKTERPLDAQGVGELRDLLQSATGFDDQIQKRCLMKHMVGVRLVRRLATTGSPREETAELALDFNCQKLFAVRGGDRGRPRSVEATHFDPSRAAFLAWVKRALPDDAELAKLH